MNPLTRPDRRRFGAIHSDQGLKDARALSLAAMDKWCEIQTPGVIGPGGGEADGLPLYAGRVRCAIGQGTRGDERIRPDQMAASGFEWEFIMPLGTSVQASWRLAWPGFLNLWTPNTTQIGGDVIAPANWVSGTSAMFRCIQTGNSGLDEPTWCDVLDGIVADGGARWQLIGWATLFEVIAVATAQSNATQLVVRAKEQG